MISVKCPSPRGVSLDTPAGYRALSAFLVTFTPSGNAVIIQAFAEPGSDRRALIEEWKNEPSALDLDTLHKDIGGYMRSIGMPPPKWGPPNWDKERALIGLEAWLELGIAPPERIS
jgi:hypothetical protein